ncbi:acyl-CoA dehydrogenase [Aliikangiella marina]|uniref:3-methylmercaptopropionyl-CoA dehydrogenase n=1 Tax=Aliikangiella marina TaxID=1712262 RepID=A0A545T1F0_9GAMM|nr:acyl-CoA dehydrogenase [Aliikangiella marina]TQV71040.1 acyl-CoA dehydrogenase [Aliikangiella marina]
MSAYTHPHNDADFVFEHIVEFNQLCQQAGLEDINTELSSAILTEAAKLGTDVLAPLNWEGDQNGTSMTEKGVQESPGFAEAYQQFVESGWPSLTAAEAFGGQNLPHVMGTAVNEVWHTSNLAFALCPMLTHGAISSLTNHGSKEMQDTWLPNMINGTWTGTMNLTEPSAGTDLAAVKTKAVPNGDHYLISGQKIFITWGDHQMTENIVHLVLARTPDAPAGVKGISLFIVPKFMLDEAGNTTDKQNDVKCISTEHKLGIHASPTCTMSFGDNGGAVGYLVGEENKGLSYMFTMMNHARQDVGLQGLAISERSYQQARDYAKERVQGTNKDGSRFTIINFPDVRRMLMLMKAGTEAMRALSYYASAEIDRSHFAADDSAKVKHHNRVELMTPIVKGWLTEFAQELTYLGTQIHGGMGFVEETGSAQHYRDARILTIYEGTTGIQALDLVGRKTLVNGGEFLQDLLNDIAETAEALKASDKFASHAAKLSSALDKAAQARQWLLDNAKEDRSAAGAISVNMMMMMGFLCGGWMMGKSAIKADKLLAAGEGHEDFLKAKLITCQFYFDHLLPRVDGYFAVIQNGGESMMAMPEDSF